MQIFWMPSANSASASVSFAVQMPTAPAASCSFAMSADLCVFACGRAPTFVPARLARIAAMFCSSLSRSSTSAGVSRSHFDTPRLDFMSVTCARL